MLELATFKSTYPLAIVIKKKLILCINPLYTRVYIKYDVTCRQSCVYAPIAKLYSYYTLIRKEKVVLQVAKTIS